MKRIITLLIVSCTVALANYGYADRNITLPHTEDFSRSNSIDDIRWVTSTSGGNVSRVQSSWRGGDDYCVRLDPPNINIGINGEYTALGNFLFPPTPVLTVAFALNVGVTYSSSAANVGGSLINKFLDTFNGNIRTGLLGINNRGNCNAHEFGVMTQTSDYEYFNGLAPACRSLHFGDGVGANDLSGKWIWVSYTLNHSTATVSLYVWDREGTFNGPLIVRNNARTTHTSEIRTLGGFFNELHPNRDTNSRLLIDDLTISSSTSPVSPPAGFVIGNSGSIAPPSRVRIIGP